MAKLKTSQIVALDCRVQQNRETIQMVLRKIKPLSKCPVGQDIPLDKVEKAIVVMERKYAMRISSMALDITGNSEIPIWRCTIVSETTLEVLHKVYGIDIYDVLTKTCIAMYGSVKQGIPLK